MAMPLVLSTHALHRDAAAALAPHARLAVASALDPATLLREGADADAIIVRAPLPPALFARAPKLRAAVRHGAGLDMIPLPEATAAGVLVANVPGANARSVAEYVVFSILALVRRFRRIDGDLRAHGWAAGRAHADDAGEIFGRTAGIVGPGAVGRAVRDMLAGAFGMRVLATGRGPVPAGFAARDLDTLLAQSDILVLCCPLTEDTRGLIGAAQLARMPPHAVLVNVARGAVVDEAALISALRERTIAGAALDVFATQPLPLEHPFFGLDNVVLTPHLAGITGESMRRMGLGAVAEVARVLAGEPPAALANPAALPRFRARFG